MDQSHSLVDSAMGIARRSSELAKEHQARWCRRKARPRLSHLLPKRTGLSRRHHGARPYADVPAFIQRLRGSCAVAALALEFLILTAVRTNEARCARWSEFDLNAKVWAIPGKRMKAGREHYISSERNSRVLRPILRLSSTRRVTSSA
jgi:integrase